MVLIAVMLVAALGYAGGRTDDELGISVSPQKLLLGTVQSGTVTVHTDVPLAAVAASTLELNGVAATNVSADSLGHVVAVFPEPEIKALVSPPSAILTLTGCYAGGGAFSGNDSVMVADHQGK
jgi:hypothetical protein